MSIQFHQGSEHCALVTLPVGSGLLSYCASQGFELIDVLDELAPDSFLVLLDVYVPDIFDELDQYAYNVQEANHAF